MDVDLGPGVDRHGSSMVVSVPGLHWALSRMLRTALLDQPARCELAATEASRPLPAPQATK